MADPLATRAHYIALYGDPPASLAGRLDALLAQASRRLRAECARAGVDIDRRIAAGDIDADLVADIVCQMIVESTQTGGIAGVSSLTQTAGAFSQTQQYANPAGRLYLTKDMKKLLGISAQKAFTVGFEV